MFLSAFAFMNADPASRTYYDKQRARGKTHAQALLRLARQRISVLFAMLRDGAFYESRTPADVEPAGVRPGSRLSRLAWAAEALVRRAAAGQASLLG